IWQYPVDWMYEDANHNGIRDFNDANHNRMKDPEELWVEFDRNGNGWKKDDVTWKLDYSDRAFNTLDENGGLDENAGIGGHPGDWTQFPNPNSFIQETGPVDWNADGVISNDPFVSADINQDGDTKDTLIGYNDWPHLHFSFLQDADFAFGALTED